jgi:hypothetical protein
MLRKQPSGAARPARLSRLSRCGPSVACADSAPRRPLSGSASAFAAGCRVRGGNESDARFVQRWASLQRLWTSALAGCWSRRFGVSTSGSWSVCSREGLVGCPLGSRSAVFHLASAARPLRRSCVRASCSASSFRRLRAGVGASAALSRPVAHLPPHPTRFAAHRARRLTAPRSLRSVRCARLCLRGGQLRLRVVDCWCLARLEWSIFWGAFRRDRIAGSVRASSLAASPSRCVPLLRCVPVRVLVWFRSRSTGVVRSSPVVPASPCVRTSAPLCVVAVL